MGEEVDLETFLVKGLFPTGKEVGRGAFGKVEEVQIPGALCVAKSIHDELLRSKSADEVRRKFARECQLMSTLRHPYIVQFLGICYLPDSTNFNVPSLVMEKLENDLHKLLESSPDIPLSVKKSILTDVANGLVYLHSQTPPIVHRDLTARNVLLSSAMTAKIGDLGVARIVNISPGKLAATMTGGPGNIIYMPPEAMEDHPRYNVSLDVFSFGTLILFTLTQCLPVLKAATYVDRDTRAIHPRSEIERRIESITNLEMELGDRNHPFIFLAKQCLENVPEARPVASEIVTRLRKMVLIPHRSWSFNKVEMIRNILASEAEKRSLRFQTREVNKETTTDREQEVVDQNSRTEHKQLKQQASNVVIQSANSSNLPQNMNADQVNKQNTIKSITWRKLKKLPKRLESATAVFADGIVYVGSERTVLCYSLETSEWNELSKPPTEGFSMAILNNQLVLVGGVTVYGMFTRDISNKLVLWDAGRKKWTQPFPNIPVARCNVCSVGYKDHLIIAGGRPHIPEDGNLITSQIEVPSCSTVDILDSTALKWLSGDPLPFECHAMQASVIGDKLYLIGGQHRFDLTKAVIWASLTNLIASAGCHDQVLSVTNSHKSYCWNVLPPCPDFSSSVPFYPSSLTVLQDGENTYINVPLLALGGLPGLQLSMLGELDTAGIITDVNVYNEGADQWTKVGELPEPCVGCACSLLPSGELFVAGGGRFRSSLSSVYIGKLCSDMIV